MGKIVLMIGIAMILIILSGCVYQGTNPTEFPKMSCDEIFEEYAECSNKASAYQSACRETLQPFVMKCYNPKNVNEVKK